MYSKDRHGGCSRSRRLCGFEEVGSRKSFYNILFLTSEFDQSIAKKSEENRALLANIFLKTGFSQKIAPFASYLTNVLVYWLEYAS